MITKNKLVFQKDVYEKSKKAFQAAEDYLGIKLFVHAKEGSLESGQIFLFNHFARFETVIPAYIFYKRLNVFTRTIADHNLFDVNDKLDSFLFGAGAVPNNLPGLLPFLAAELLKGHKVVIFPEGAMMKDRQVMDDQGRFRIFSHAKQTYRKHHTGAAVLALTLDLFKQRVKELFNKGDLVRLDHWCEALEFKDHAELKEQIEKPTLIVPGTITFHPIRIGGNFLSKTIKLLTKDISERLLEEVIIEGNILLKDTDMDIRFGEPIQSKKKWRQWEKVLLNYYFFSIKSLEEFFSLKDQAITWSERLLTKIIYKETSHIRDEYMKGIYRGITINISHIASVLVFAYREAGQTEIRQNKFHQALYLAVKELQSEPDIHLNYNLSKPANYRFLAEGESPRFKQFLKTAKNAKLIEKTKDSYILLDKLTEEHDYHEVRRENPIFVSANEVEPVSEVRAAIAKAIKETETEEIPNFTYQMWDDELRAFAWETEKYSRDEYHEINQYETAFRDREPYLLTHKNKSPIGVLLVHGFLSSPAELSQYGEHIHKQGFNVLGVRLSGHGTSPYDLNNRSWEDWLDSLRRGHEILSTFAEEIIVVGFSAGGALALLFASERPKKLNAVISVCAAIEIQDKGIHFAPYMNGINKLASYFPKVDGVMNYKRSSTKHEDTNYRSIPIKALTELKQLMKVTRKKLSNIVAPVLVIQSDQDVVVEPDSANIIIEGLASKQKELKWVETDSHDLIRNNLEGTWSLLDEYLQSRVTTKQHNDT
ncbi:alpha/beta fold hydrolase [Gammaproteobacteria bacterium]|nr:alpha/beta fold hydrolase [Gammaproteobacteria bacterium]